MRRAKSGLGGQGRDAGEIRLQGMRPQARDALKFGPPPAYFKTSQTV
jgi:hypothetical protein